MVDLVTAGATPPPRLAVRAALALRRRLLAFADAAVPPQLVLFEQAMGTARTQLLRTAARLRLAERLAGGPRASEDLAREAGVDPDALHRVLRALVAGGVFGQGSDGRFSNNRLSTALHGDALGSMRAFAEYAGSASHVGAWADLDRTVETGRSAFRRVHGSSVWDWFATHDDERRTFAESMVHFSEIDAPAVAAGYPFGDLATVCDVGGGRGALLAAILRRHPRPRGVLFDDSDVLAEAPAYLATRGVAGRVTCRPGSFFEAVPEGCDAYLLKDVLHDWDDAACLRILAACRRAAPPGSRLLVAEVLVERGDASSPGALIDVQMMTVCEQGRQRGRAELQRLLARAGFRPGRVLELAGPASIVEAIA